MFADAYSIAQKFTLPLVISHRQHNGECFAGVGAFVIINEDGWVVTASHIVEQLLQLENAQNQYKDLLKQKQAIELDNTKKPYQKQHLINALKIQPQAVSVYSAWFADNHKVNQWVYLNDIDLAVGQLQNFDKTKYSMYPKFKDPTKPMLPGTSLCKLGFPFYQIKPTYNEVGNSFELPLGVLPIPFFPLEGIFTRTVHLQTPNPQPFPLMYIETSSPGLRGQSGGPTFDVQGTIWAIQCMTQHLKLGFGGNASTGTGNKEMEYLKNQYLHVGWGVHSETLINFFNQQKIKFELSPY